MSDGRFASWAAGVAAVQYGPDVDSVWKVPGNALGPAEGTAFDVVTLGRGGRITLTFENGIGDGPGADFAVFENSFDDDFLELAFVEVSSNGTDFFRFPNRSLTPTPVSAFGSINPTNIDGFAGKYRQGWGTPFDLTDLAGVSPKLNVGNVTHLRLVDVVGDGSARDSDGRVIWDPYPAILTAGFDLDAVGVIHEGQSTVDLTLRHVGFDYTGVEEGAGPHAPGSEAQWSVTSPWPSAAGSNGRRWIAEPAAGTVAMDGDRVVEVQWQEQVHIEVNGQPGFGSTGSGWYGVGAEIVWSVQSPVPVSEGVRLRAETASGRVEAVAPASIDPVWVREAFLEIRRNRAGIVSPASGWYGGIVTVTAEDRVVGDEPVYMFREWQGDLAGTAARSGDRQIELSMAEPRIVTALFDFAEGLATQTATVTLRKGWNLVSLPVFGTETALAALGARHDMVLPAWGWDAPGGQYSALLHALPGQGFWVLGRSDGVQLRFEGYHPGDLVPTPSGAWQLFGISRADGSAVPAGGEAVWEWDAARQIYRTVETLVEGRAYWRYYGR